MNKKLISALFVGALLLGSTSALTSCKDYDDDIDNLQTQIDKAALTSDVDALKTSLTSAITTAQTAATTAQTTADKAVSAASTAQTTADAAKTAATAAQTAADAAKTAADAAQTSGDAAKTAAAAAQTSGDAAQATANEAVAAATAAQAAADKAQAAADKAQTAADNGLEEIAKTQADLADSNERIATLEKNLADLTSLEATLQGTVESNTNAIKDLQKQFANLKIEIMNIIGTMVTDVNVFASYINKLNTSDETFKDVLDYNTNISNYGFWASLNKVKATVMSNISYGYFTLVPMTGTQSKATFGEDPAADHTISYTKGASINFPATLVIRVNPTNYKPDKADIKLVNSKGEDLSSVLEVTSVEKYDEVLITRGVDNGTGLWNVKFQLKDGVTADDVEALTLSGEKEVLFAVAVNNTSDDNRSVVSSYDVTIPNVFPYSGSNSLSSILVNKTPITSIHNRYIESETVNASGTVTSWYGGTGSGFADKKWSGDPQVYNKDGYDGAFVTAAGGGSAASGTGDNRNSLAALAVNAGTPFTVDINNSAVNYYYVTLDTPCANQSQDTELAAWKSYTYSPNSINTMTKASDKLNITVSGVNHDIIGFRVYAVNYDGTLVDPDGEAFYVEVGKAITTANVSGDVTVTVQTGSAYTSNYAILPITGASFQTSGNATGTGIELFDANDVKKGEVSYQLLTANDITKTTADWTKAKYIAVAITSDVTNWLDNATLTGKIEGKNTSGTNTFVANTINLSITKKLPTTFPDTFGWKAGQLNGTAYTCYVEPYGPTTGTDADSWDDYTSTWVIGAYASGSTINGTKQMTYVCNGLTSTEAATTYDGYKFTFANTAYKTDGKTLTDLVLTSNSYNLGGSPVSTSGYKFAVNKAFIDSSTDHATTISYVYNNVSSVNDATNGHNVVVNGWTGTTKFACLLSTTLQSYAWVDAPAVKGSGTDTNPQYAATAMNILKYSTAVGTKQYIAAKFLKGTNSFDPTRFTMTFDGALNTYYSIKSAKLVSDATGTVDYFDVTASLQTATAAITSDGSTGSVLSFEFTPKSETSVPNADVPSTLKLTLVDAFGHENLYSLPVLIKK